MPRLTPLRYLETHRWLASLWRSQQTVFGFLTYRDQMYLHDYFLLSRELTDEELLIHRHQVKSARPSLPQCAGRALQQLAHAVEVPARVPVPAGSGSSVGPRRVVVRSIARPEVDSEEVINALLQAVRDIDLQDHDDAA